MDGRLINECWPCGPYLLTTASCPIKCTPITKIVGKSESWKGWRVSFIVSLIVSTPDDFTCKDGSFSFIQYNSFCYLSADIVEALIGLESNAWTSSFKWKATIGKLKIVAVVTILTIERRFLFRLSKRDNMLEKIDLSNYTRRFFNTFLYLYNILCDGLWVNTVGVPSKSISKSIFIRIIRLQWNSVGNDFDGDGHNYNFYVLYYTF